MRGKNSARWHCSACNKTAFGSQSRAMETQEWLAYANLNATKLPTRAYPCEYGNGWHLTSQEVRR